MSKPLVPEALLNAIKENKVVLFAGAGLSRGTVNTGNGRQEQYLPSWEGLLVVLIMRAKKRGYIEDAEAVKLKKAVDEKKYLFVAETIRRILGKKEFDDTLEEIFRNPQLSPTNRHILITNIPFNAVITTNYDKLLESAYAVNGYIPPTYSFDNCADAISSLSNNRFFILKAHGDIDRKDTIVLSERDYRDVVYRQPGYRATLTTIFITKTVLFIGSSLSDTDVNLILETASESFGGKTSKHFALLPIGELYHEEARHWRDFFGIEIIPYKATKSHPEVDFFLKEIIKSIKTN